MVDGQVPVLLSGQAVVVATVTDRLARRFDNFSSLLFKWSTSDDSLGEMEESEDSTVLDTLHKRKDPFCWQFFVNSEI